MRQLHLNESTVFRRSKGYSLIEVMIVVSLTIALVIQAVPLVGGWFDTINMTKAQSALTAAFSNARGTAQLNKNKVGLDTPVTVLCFSNGLLSVQEIDTDANQPCTDDGAMLSSSVLPPKLKLISHHNQETKDLSCLCFGASGLSTIGGICRTCSRPIGTKIKIGEKEIDSTVG